MWATIAKYIGAELFKQFMLGVLQYVAAFFAERKQKRLDAVKTQRTILIAAIEAARLINDVQEIKRITIAYNKLPKL